MAATKITDQYQGQTNDKVSPGTLASIFDAIWGAENRHLPFYPEVIGGVTARWIDALAVVYDADSLDELLEAYEKQETATIELSGQVGDGPQATFVFRPALKSGAIRVTAADRATVESALQVVKSTFNRQPPEAVPSPEGIRADLWALVQADVDGRNFDAAISSAFRHVEAEIQQLSGSAAIGNTLIETTFGNRIVISSRTQDTESLKSLFKGSIGFYKGARSHGSMPTVPIRTREKCLRVLTLAAELLDLLDHDQSRRPAITSYRQGGEAVEFRCTNVGPTAQCLIDDQERTAISRSADRIALSSTSLALGQHMAVLVNGSVSSLPFEFEILAEQPASWHRVLQADVPMYSDSEAENQRSGFGVVLESYEGGRLLHRCFPTKIHYDAGVYVSWEWPEVGESLDETWIRDPSGQIVPAWNGSTYFGGRPTQPEFSPRVTGIRLSPEGRVQLGVEESMPLMLLERWGDGIGVWESPSRSDLDVTSSDESIVFVDRKKQVVRAKQPGTAQIEVSRNAYFVQTTIDVVSLKCGSVLKILDGLKRASGVAYKSGPGLFITDGGHAIHSVSVSGELNLYTELARPYLYTPGLDNIAITDDGTLYIRSPGSRALIQISASDPKRHREVPLPDDRIPISHCTTGDSVLITDHMGRLWLFADGGLQPFVDVITPADGSHTLTHVAANPETVWVLDNRTGLYVVDRQTRRVSVGTHGGSNNQFSSMTWHRDQLYLTDFHGGKIISYQHGALTEVAAGLDLPGSITAEGDTAFVTNMGSGGIARIIL